MFDFSTVEISKEEYRLIAQICKKAVEFNHGYKIDFMSLNMDLTAVHSQTPLKLKELLEADEHNFAHDVCGIMRHLNRETGELEHCFIPRYTA